MADKTENAMGAAAKTETPAIFLTALGKLLRESQGFDVGLADVLAKHILIHEPAKDAVAQARDAIVKLADGRAAPKAVAKND